MNIALPEMFAGNNGTPSVLERQQARLKWHHDQFHDSFLGGSELSDLFTVDPTSQQPQVGVAQFQGFAAGDSVKPDPGFENGWPSFAKFDVCSVGFNVASVGYGNNGSGYDVDYAISRTSSCPPAVVAAAASEAAEKGKESVVSEKLSSAPGKESFKKRKSEKAQIPKVCVCY